MTVPAPPADPRDTDPVDEAYGQIITVGVVSALGAGMTVDRVLSWVRAALEAHADE